MLPSRHYVYLEYWTDKYHRGETTPRHTVTLPLRTA